MKKKRLAIALGAGGARGVAHVGFLQALDEANIQVDAIVGTSMGAVVGSCYASGLAPKEIQDILKKIKLIDLIDWTIFPVTKLGLMGWRKVRNQLDIHLKGMTFENLKIPFSCVAVNLLDGELVHLKSGNLIDAVLASSAIPSIFQPVKIEDKLFVDGGILCRVPIEQARESKADVVIAVDILEGCPPMDKVSNIFTLLSRVFDIIENASAERVKERLTEACDLWLTPKMPNVNAYKVAYNEEAYEAGYTLGVENIDKIKKLLAK